MKARTKQLLFSMLKKIEVAKAFFLVKKSYESNKRFCVMQGSARAGKTYNILHFLIALALYHVKNQTISIVRKTLPALKASAERDFFEILNLLGLYNEANHNKTERIYRINSNTFEFFSCDNEQKLRGRKRNILFANEANELDYETFQQLNLRTTDFIVLDYNPSDEFSYIYDKIIPRPETDFYKLTYKDNPFLPQSVVAEIENLKNIDENAWRVFGLGERGVSLARVYTNYTLIDELPSEYDEEIFGIDFGYNNPTAVLQIRIKDNEIFVKELLYQSYLTNHDLIECLKVFNISKSSYIYADSAEPARIAELRRAGFNVLEARKEVQAGIIAVKQRKMHVVASSENLLDELKMYKYKQDANGRQLDEVVKHKDHACDALRYAVFTHFANNKSERNASYTGRKKVARF